MSSAQYDENRQLSTVMASELCLLSSRMQNTWPNKVHDIIHEYCVVSGSIQTYLPILGNTEHNIHSQCFTQDIPFIYISRDHSRAQEFTKYIGLPFPLPGAESARATLLLK